MATHARNVLFAPSPPDHRAITFLRFFIAPRHAYQVMRVRWPPDGAKLTRARWRVRSTVTVCDESGRTQAQSVIH